VVGDSYQSIYRFRGAVDAMDQFAADPLPLSQSWRFGENVARLANRILLSHSQRPRFRLTGNPAVETQIIRYGGRLDIAPGTCVLARSNARLFTSLAPLARPFHLVGGFRDLERQVTSAWALRCGRVRDVVDQAVARFSSWAHLDAAAERGDGEARRWRMIVEAYGGDLPAIVARLGALHRERESDAQIVVSTAHKAKGREFDAVVVLEDFPLPSELRARRQQKPELRTEIDQEINLLYVACTRARRRLMLAEGLYQELV
jgi:F-box protein, helicase, 18